ncbi:MAG: hypothetical protein M3Z11_01845 [Candidatus Dormibacteraeota bacterium]|nr:hypothetical protein [Candidatus Dormibacteraeota bacterium]
MLAGGTALTCQLVNSGTSSARAETAFSVAPFSLPFWHRDAHLEMTVRADGTLGRATGAFGLRHGLILDTGAVGNRTTSRFAVDRPWQLRYQFDCRAAPGGRFEMEMRADQPSGNGVGGFSAGSGPPEELARADTVQMSQAGVYHFQVTSACSWHVTVSD